MSFPKGVINASFIYVYVFNRGADNQRISSIQQCLKVDNNVPFIYLLTPSIQ